MERNRAADLREFYALLPVVAAHFKLAPVEITKVARVTINNGYVSARALECYRSIVRSL